MARIEQRSLIFHIGDVGFLLEYHHIVEVLGAVGDAFDFNRSDLRNHIVAAIDFRKTLIPVFDPAGLLNITSAGKIRGKSIIVLRSTEGNWALAVDGIDELTARERFLPCTVPDLLKPFVGGYYSQIRLIEEKPYVVFDPEKFYGAAVDTK
jgi:chemotaxis signal transduction protein